jgi:excisionase family DNA binding protein
MIESNNHKEKFLSVEEAAKFLRVKPSTIRFWTYSKKIPFIKLGKSSSSTVRFKRSELLKWLDRHSKGSNNLLRK